MISRTEYSFLSQQSVMSAPAKTARFLSPNRISELVWDSESEEAGAPSDSFFEDEGGCEDESGVSDPQLNRPTSSAQASGSSFPSSASDEEDFFRVGKTNRSKYHPFRSGHGPLALTEV